MILRQREKNETLPPQTKGVESYPKKLVRPHHLHLRIDVASCSRNQRDEEERALFDFDGPVIKLLEATNGY